MITRASFRNFKSLREVDVTFDSRLTVLVGPNGSGKSSILQGINLICQAAYDPSTIDATRRVLPSRLSTVGNADEVSLEGGCTTETGTAVVLRLSVDGLLFGPGLSSTEPGWRYFVEDTDGRQEWVGEAPPPKFYFPLKFALGPAVLLQMDARRLAEPAGPKSIPPTVQPDGSGLAPALSDLKLNQKPVFDGIMSELRNIIPGIADVRFETVSIHPNPYQQGILFDFSGATGVRATEASTGTLHALGLLAVILGPNRPRIVLLDDIDQGLHPKAQLELIAVLRRIMARNSDLQIIATSHSPYILDRLEWNEVRVTTLNDDGSAVCKPLTDHPDYERWKDAMSPGEFWGTFYEDWLKRAPAATPEPVA